MRTRFDVMTRTHLWWPGGGFPHFTVLFAELLQRCCSLNYFSGNACTTASPNMVTVAGAVTTNACSPEAGTRT